jgi:hypothetical protein
VSGNERFILFIISLRVCCKYDTGKNVAAIKIMREEACSR